MTLAELSLDESTDSQYLSILLNNILTKFQNFWSTIWRDMNFLGRQVKFFLFFLMLRKPEIKGCIEVRGRFDPSTL